MTEEEKLIIAYHETGHALVGWALPNADPIHKVTIIPRGRALGYTQALPDSEKYLTSKAELKDRLAMLMGGRVAEELILLTQLPELQMILRKQQRLQEEWLWNLE